MPAVVLGLGLLAIYAVATGKAEAVLRALGAPRRRRK